MCVSCVRRRFLGVFFRALRWWWSAVECVFRASGGSVLFVLARVVVLCGVVVPRLVRSWEQQVRCVSGFCWGGCVFCPGQFLAGTLPPKTGARAGTFPCLPACSEASTKNRTPSCVQMELLSQARRSAPTFLVIALFPFLRAGLFSCFPCFCLCAGRTSGSARSSISTRVSFCRCQRQTLT